MSNTREKIIDVLTVVGILIAFAFWMCVICPPDLFGGVTVSTVLLVAMVCVVAGCYVVITVIVLVVVVGIIVVIVEGLFKNRT